jgi:hypothetical protein
MEKAIVNQKQAKSLDLVLERNTGKSTFPASFIENHAKYPDLWVDFKGINGMDLDTLIRALYVGYEVVKSPEEKVLHYYNSLTELIDDRETNSLDSYELLREKMGVKNTLHFLGMKIEGIN